MISDRERAALARAGFTEEDVRDVEAAIEAGDVFIAFDRDGSARIHFRGGDVLEPVEEPEEREA